MLYRINFISHKGSLQVVNTLHMVTADVAWWEAFDTDNPDPVDVANEVDAQLTTLYRAMLRSTYTLDRISVVTVGQPGNAAQVPSAGEKAIGALGTRSGTGEDLPPQMCGLIGLRTSHAGRSFRGRMFCPPAESVPEVGSDQWVLAGNYGVAINAFRAKLDDNVGGGTSWSTLWQSTWNARFVVYSPTRHQRNQTPFYTPIQATRFDGSIHWLRSRAK